MKKKEQELLTLPSEIIFENNSIKNIKYKKVFKKVLLEELYLLLLSKGPGYHSSIEYWDPTLDAIILMEELNGSKTSKKVKEEKEENS